MKKVLSIMFLVGGFAVIASGLGIMYKNEANRQNALEALKTSIVNDYEDFKVAAEFVAEVVQKLDAYKIPPKTILNINVPGLEKEDIAGIAVTELGGKMFTNAYERRIDPRGKVYYWMAGELVNESDEAGNRDRKSVV